MWLQFFAQNAHFAINMLVALACMAITWLYFDAWAWHKDKKEFFKWFGFGVLSLSFLAQATLIEQSVLGHALAGDLTLYVIVVCRVIGYAGIIVGLILEPPHIIPKNEGFDFDKLADALPKKEESPPVSQPAAKASSSAPAVAPVLTAAAVVASPPVVTPSPQVEQSDTPSVTAAPSAPASSPAATPVKIQFPAVYGAGITIGKWIVPLGGFAIAVMYWRIATAGLERHLKKIAIGFGFLALSDTIGLAALLRDTTNPVVFSWVKPFSWIWMTEQFVLLLGAIMLGRWVWSYLTKRFFSQLFMVFIASTVVIATIVCAVFTSLLLRDIRHGTLNNLTTAGKVLNYAITSKQAETTAGAEQIATDGAIAEAVAAKDHTKLVALTKEYLVKKRQSSLLITNASGQVLLRVEDPEQWGDSVSNDTLVQRALLGTHQSSVKVGEGVGAPAVQVRSAASIRDASGKVVGAAISSLDLGSAFVDGVKQATSLESSIYGSNTLAATTLTAADGKTRNVGTKLSDTKIADLVAKQGKPYVGSFQLQNKQLLGSFLPLKDADNVTVGMLLVSQPESDILATAGRSIEMTFLFMVVFLVLTVLPAYFITRSLERQIE